MGRIHVGICQTDSAAFTGRTRLVASQHDYDIEHYGREENRCLLFDCGGPFDDCRNGIRIYNGLTSYKYVLLKKERF
jgi:hypothetical protein